MVVVAVLGIAALFALAPSGSGDIPPKVPAPGDASAAEADQPDLSSYGTPIEAPLASGFCEITPLNGDILLSHINLIEGGGHTLEIQNGSLSSAIVKARRPHSTHTLFSFFVEAGSEVVLRGVPDGSYQLLFGLGEVLDQPCVNFIGRHKAFQFPRIETLATERSATEVTTARLTYTLHAVPSGNTRTEPIDTDIFDQD